MDCDKLYKAASCVVLLDLDGCVLLTKRKNETRNFPRAWVLPGGHLEAGETLEQGAIRELFEETGIEIEISSGN